MKTWKLARDAAILLGFVWFLFDFVVEFVR